MRKFILDIENIKIDQKSLALMNKKNDNSSLREESESLIRDFSAITDFNHPIKHENCLSIILKTISKPFRTIVDVQIIKVCLRQIPYINILLEDESSYSNQELFFKMANYLRHEKSEVNQILYKTGQNPDKFYIILKGSVSILRTKEIKTSLSEEEYKEYLKRLYDSNELFMFEYLLKKNKHVFGEYMHKDIDLYKRNKTSNANISNLNYPNKINKEKYLSQINITNNINNETETITPKEVKKYKNVCICEYYVDKTLNAGDVFGYFSINIRSSVGQGTIIANMETDFAVMDKKSYDDITKDITDKFRRNIMRYLNNCYIFKKIDKVKLEQYIGYFNQYKTISGSKIFQEGESLKEIYFINKGVYELSKRLSLIELINIISNYTQKEEDKSFIDMIEYEVKYNSREYNKLLNEKKKIVFFSYTEGDIVGLEDFRKDNRHFFTLEHSKLEGEIFKIEINVFIRLIKQFIDIHDNLELIKSNVKSYLKMKKRILIDKMIEIRNNKLKMFNLMNAETASHSNTIKLRKRKELDPSNSGRQTNLYISSPIKFFHPEINYYHDNIRINCIKHRSSRNKLDSKFSFKTISSSNTFSRTGNESNNSKPKKILLFKANNNSNPIVKIEELKFEKKLSKPIDIPLTSKTLYKFKFKLSHTPLHKVPDKCNTYRNVLTARNNGKNNI